MRLRILVCRNDSNRKRIFSLQLTAHSWWLLSSYRLPHHGNRSFAVALDDILPYSPSRRQILHVRSGWRLTFPSLWHFPFPIIRVTCFPQIVILNGGKNALWEKRKRNSGMEWRIYYTDDILPIFLTTETDSSHSFRMAPYRLIQGSWSWLSEGARWRT